MKVVVTGYNMITSLGLDADETWKNLVAGKSGVKRITLFNPSENSTQIAAQVPDEFEAYSRPFIKKRLAKQMTRVTQMCLTCCKNVVINHHIEFEKVNKMRYGVIVGVVNTGNSSVEKGTTAKNTILKGMNNAMSAWIALEYGLEGPNFT